ncbi:MAG: hypothetical protein AUJ49_01605 [Desulfovibrionaceae bacterium CG1_02_65_16]|nr:MAG: hypothetical protein AUJ49_01605 [Desulfovibrionaceae bacterium CG1_02_65_16]
MNGEGLSDRAKETAGAERDHADEAYWDASWRRDAPTPVDLDDARLRNHVNLRLGRLLDHVLAGLPDRRPGWRTFRSQDNGAAAGPKAPPPPGQSQPVVIEAGCGGSAWLPVFAQRHGCAVIGVDYSARGCALARATLEQAGAPGRVIQADLFDPPAELAGCADVVFSQGLAEHFSPTSALTARLAWLLKPGGLALTIVPNMRGLTGLAQRLADRQIFNLHVPLNPMELARAHAEAGLTPLEHGWLGTLNLGVVNCSGLPRAVARPLTLTFAGVSMAAWALERALRAELPNGLTSPQAYCVARKPGA